MARKPKTMEAAADPVAESETTIPGIKGFDLNLRCRDFQFEIGKTYTHDGPVVVCRTGFHAVTEYPLDVFDFYSPGLSRYADVSQSGEISREGSKLASAVITIKAELSIPFIVERAVAWVIAHTTTAGSNHATGDQSASSATGDRSASSATGYQSASSATGYRSASSATGYQSAAMSVGQKGRVLGAAGCALFLVYRNPNNGDILHVWAGIAGRDGIKPMVFYTLDADGKPQEVAP